MSELHIRIEEPYNPETGQGGWVYEEYLEA